MDDLVLATVAEALASQHIAIVRFNFRGVGASAGAHKGDGAEVDDLRAVLSWLQSEHPDAGVILAGYSFGASVVARILPELQIDLQRVLLVAPPLGNLSVPIPDGTIPVDIFVGDNDAFCDRDTLAEWSALDLPGTGAHIMVHVMKGADHFFGGQSRELADLIRESVRR